MLMNSCCCDPSCTIFKDDFDRANNNDIGSNWTETGTVEISSNQLRMTGSGTAITALSHISELMVVRVVLSIGSGTIGTKSSEIIVNYKDSSNYHFVRIDGVYSGLATPVRTDLKFYKRSAGIDTQLGSTRVLDAANVITSIDITVCFDGTYLSAAGFREATTKIVDGFKAGLSATAAATAINWNDFKWYKFAPNCPSCTTSVTCTGFCEQNHPATHDIIIDLGIGGLVDGTCNACDDVRGEYILTTINESNWIGPAFPFSTLTKCAYGYMVCNACNVSGHSFAIITLRIAATVTATEWLASIELISSDKFRPCNTNISYFYHRSRYSGPLATPHHCDETPVTLNRISSDSFGAAVCSGTLPATIELRLI